MIDLILILLVYLFARLGLESAMSVIRESPAIFIGIGALLQVMAFAASALLLFPFKSDAEESAPKGQTILYAILLLPVIFGPQWLHIPADALLTESLKKSSWLAGSILGISIMTVYALQITLWIQIASREDQIKEHKSSHQLRRICAPAIATFLFFAELMILTGMQIMPEKLRNLVPSGSIDILILTYPSFPGISASFCLAGALKRHGGFRVFGPEVGAADRIEACMVSSILVQRENRISMTGSNSVRFLC